MLKVLLTCKNILINNFLKGYNKSQTGSICFKWLWVRLTCSSISYKITVRSETHLGLSILKRFKVGPIKWHAKINCSSVFTIGCSFSLTNLNSKIRIKEVKIISSYMKLVSQIKLTEPLWPFDLHLHDAKWSEPRLTYNCTYFQRNYYASD